LACARRHRSFPKVSDLRQFSDLRSTATCAPPTLLPGSPCPELPSPPAPPVRRSHSSAKPLLRTETTRVLRPRITALLDGNRPGRYPRPNPVTHPRKRQERPFFPRKRSLSGIGFGSNDSRLRKRVSRVGI
jgi:hypothetical protein